MSLSDFPFVTMADLGNNVVPEATYSLKVIKAEFVPVPKRGSNPYVKVSLRIVGPENDPSLGRMVFANYPLSGGGAYRLHELLKVTGHADDFKLEGEHQLIGLELMAAVMVEAGTNGYPDKNVIRRHMPLYSA